MVLFVFVLVAFAVMGQKLYGRQLLGFKDFSFCLMTLFRLTFGIGDDPYDAMLTANPDVKAFTTVYYLGFVFISSIVLVNIFLAILVDAFAAYQPRLQPQLSMSISPSTHPQPPVPPPEVGPARWRASEAVVAGQ